MDYVESDKCINMKLIDYVSTNSDASETIIKCDSYESVQSHTLRSYNNWSPEEHGATIVWRDLNVYVLQEKFRAGKTLKRIINNVTGAVRPGTLVALMGASGAGKSTLMSALAYRSTPGTIIQGDILVNGRKVGPFMHCISGFMHQHDVFLGALTVYEHMSFMANLKLDRLTTRTQKRKLISDTLDKAGLLHRANTRIGFEGDEKVLSGGEKKRLSFATEILTKPTLLFCDEPTTGLDSYSAQKLVQTLQDVARQGTGIICTIHQPSSQLFAMFDQVLLLADGRVAFMGAPERALDFFSSHGYECPKDYNPAEFLIGLLATTPGAEKASQRVANRFCDLFAISEDSQERDVLVNLEMHIAETVANYDKQSCGTFHYPFWYSTLFQLTWRKLLCVLRDPQIQVIRTIQKVVIAVMVGLCFTGTINLTQNGIQSVQGALFMMISENTFSPMYSVLAYYPKDFPLFIREKQSGLYSTAQYYMANLIALFPGLVFEPFLFVLVGYWMVGLRTTAYAFFMTAFLAILVMNVATACGCFFSNTFKSVPQAMAYLVPFDYSLMITSGLFVNLTTIPAYIYWVQYISWMMYANEAMTIIQWDGITNITCPVAEDLPCLENGDEVLQHYSFSPDHLCRNIIALVILFVVFHTLGYISLLRSARKS